MTNRDRTIFGTAWALLLSGIAVILMLAIHPLSAQASTTAVNWRQRTCNAAQAYASHQGAARLTTLVTDSTHLGRSYLRADVGQLYADASSPSPKAAKYAVKDIGYIRDDCS